LDEVSRSRSALLLSIVLSCSEEPAPAPTGIDLTIAWDSTMGVDRLVVWGTTAEGTSRIEQQTIPAPYSVDPPGLRVAPIDLVLVDALEGETVVVRVDARSAGGEVVGSGATSVTVELDRLVPASVTLGSPVACGDARTSNLEACDDGNQIAGDGCSDVCTIEPGHVCAGSPSICGRCGDGTATGGEQCDDRNNADGDGCSSTCMLEAIGELIHEVERPEPAVTMNPEFEDIPGATLTFTPNSPGDRWIVFASGALGSSDPSEVAAEMRLLVNGIEVDRFGHQTLGAEDNEAGFVTFETITGAAEEQVITLQFRAVVGATRARNLRVVAALIPPGADFHYAEADDPVELAGDDLELLRLDFTPSRAGDYVVLAKGNFTEDPSGATAQLWLEDEQGGALPPEGFSAPRDALVPAFIAAVRPLDLSAKSFVVRGRSSANAVAGDWWNEAFARRIGIDITAPASGLPTGHPIGATFDHASEVAAGRSLASGDDVFVVARMADGALVPIDRVVDEATGWNRSDTRIWFATVDGVTPEYWIYWGALATQLPPSDPEKVFSFFDRFDGNALDPNRWAEDRGGAVVQNGQLSLGPQAAARSTDLHAYGIDTIWEAQVTLSTVGAFAGTLDIWTAGALMDAGIGFFGSPEGLAARTPQLELPIMLADPFAPHLFAFVRRAAEVTFQIDGQPVATLPDGIGAAANLPVRMANGDASVTMTYDWVRVRPLLPEEPVVAVGAVEVRAPFIPSRFSHKKLMVFRSDVFARARHASMQETVSTTAIEPTTIVSLDVEAPAAEVDELLIAAARVSGESSATGRKSGEVRAAGEVLLRTAHRIDRDSSRANGYHHVVGVVDGRTTSTEARHQIDILSPDAIQVDGAGATIIVLSYPSRR
jgi:cysteine-rich repeat protein